MNKTQNIKKSIILLLMILAVVICIDSTSAADGSWQNEVVDDQGDLGLDNSLAIDQNENPHIAYSDFETGTLKYASEIDGIWAIETVDNTQNVGRYCSLALDSNDNPHISYQACGDNLRYYLKYASKVNGNWIIETVDTESHSDNAGVGFWTSLAIDENDNPHISYAYHLKEPDFLSYLKYASKVDGTWTIETVDNDGNVGLYSSLAFDTNGNPHISYSDIEKVGLKYASKIGDTWFTETVDNQYAGFGTSLAFDPYDYPHISYITQRPNPPYGIALKYASKVAGIWTIETVDPNEKFLFQTSLAFDPHGNPHISYICRETGNNGDQELRYASRVGSVWTIEVVESYHAGGDCSLAFDGNGNPYISYADIGHGLHDDGILMLVSFIPTPGPNPKPDNHVKAIETVPMQSTGAPILPLALASLLAAGGVISTKGKN